MKPPCSVEGCNRESSKRGMCNTHYIRWRRHGDVNVVRARRYGPSRICEVEGCDETVLAKGKCRPHYEGWTPKPMFWQHVEMPGDLDGCWLWVGPDTGDGYGRCGKGTGRIYSASAHRRCYQMLIGDIPDGLCLDHLCRNRRCISPWHLEPVTLAENIRRGAHAWERTHCPQGHEFTPENTRIYKGSKFCIECNREAGRRYRERKKALRA